MDRLGAGRAPWWIATLGESGCPIWLMGSGWILKSCPHPAFNLAVRGRAVENAPGSSVSCRTLVSGKVDRRLEGSWASSFGGPVAFGAGVAWMKQLFLVSIFGLPARRLKPGAACGCGLCLPLASTTTAKNPHIDSLSSPLTRPPLHPFPPLKLFA